MEKELLKRIIDKQFEIIDVNLKYEDLIGLKINGKSWSQYYFFKENQYKEWKDWLKVELDKVGKSHDFHLIIMLYGMHVKKRG